MMEGVEKEVNVLIVEDDKYISNFICMSLKQEGYHYLKADTGREAIGLSYANNPGCCDPGSGPSGYGRNGSDRAYPQQFG